VGLVNAAVSEGNLLVEISQLNWKKVVTSDGVTIGELQGGDVDKDWQVTRVHVGLNDAALKEFGLKKPFLGRVLICLPTDLVQSIGDTIILKKRLQDLRNTKECQEFSVK
jgi:sporulation protein YlmC with PRC-barrel domain